MSIRSECFNLCKQIWNVLYRSNVNDLIMTLRERAGFRDLIPSFTKYQFLSPLYIHYNQSNFINTISGVSLSTDIHQLANTELDLLHQCHFLINSINEKCLQKVIDKFPELKSCLNPYDRFMKLEVSEFSIESLIDPKLIQPLVESFQKHEAYQGILTQIPEAQVRLQASSLPQNLEKFFGALYKSINDIPSWVKEVPERHSDEYWACRLTHYSVCINSILSNINQLIYQAFLSKTLVVLDEDSIIHIAGQTSNLVCEETTITIQAQETTISCLPYEIVLIQYMSGERQVKSFAQIMTLTVSIGIGNQGMTQEFALRMIDESLNPYFGLVDRG